MPPFPVPRLPAGPLRFARLAHASCPCYLTSACHTATPRPVPACLAQNRRGNSIVSAAPSQVRDALNCLSGAAETYHGQAPARSSDGERPSGGADAGGYPSGSQTARIRRSSCSAGGPKPPTNEVPPTAPPQLNPVKPPARRATTGGLRLGGRLNKKSPLSQGLGAGAAEQLMTRLDDLEVSDPLSNWVGVCVRQGVHV